MIGIFLQRWPFSIIYAQSAGAMSGTEKLGGLVGAILENLQSCR